MPELSCFTESSTLQVFPYFLEANSEKLALLALSHSLVEQRLYEALLDASRRNGERAGMYSVKRLSGMVNGLSPTTIRRGLAGLCKKLSIERLETKSTDSRPQARSYFIYSPDEIFNRRKNAGWIHPESLGQTDNADRCVTLKRLIECWHLSRREAEVAIHCAEGLANSKIAQSLNLSEGTVKFHLRYVFTKLRIKRRTELILLVARQEYLPLLPKSKLSDQTIPVWSNRGPECALPSQ